MKKINYYRGLLMAGLVVLHFGAASHVYEVTGQEFAGGAKAVAWEEMVLGDVVMFENSGDTGLTGNMQEEVTDIPVAGQEAVTDIPVAGQEVVTDMLPDMKPGEENTWNTAFTDEEENYDMTETEESVCVDFIMSVTEDVPTVKAGEAVGYEIMLENIGNVDLENLELRSILDNGKLEGEWLERQGFDVDTANGVAVLELLEAGTAQKVVLMAEIPEERQENLPAEFVAKVRNPLFGEESVSAAAEMEYLSRSQGLTTQILPLEIAFTVQK